MKTLQDNNAQNTKEWYTKNKGGVGGESKQKVVRTSVTIWI